MVAVTAALLSGCGLPDQTLIHVSNTRDDDVTVQTCVGAGGFCIGEHVRQTERVHPGDSAGMLVLVNTRNVLIVRDADSSDLLGCIFAEPKDVSEPHVPVDELKSCPKDSA